MAIKYFKIKTKIPQISKPTELIKSKSYQALPIYNIQNSSYIKNNSPKDELVDDRVNRKVEFEMKKNNISGCDSNDIETSPVEEVLNHQPIQKNLCNDIVNISNSNVVLKEKSNTNIQNLIKHSNSQSLQSPVPNKNYEDKKNDYPIIDLNYHFQSFKNQKNQSSSPNYCYERNFAKESIFETKSDLKSIDSENCRSSLERNKDFETKRQEVLKRKDMIEKQRIDKINQKIKEKEEKFKKIHCERKENRFLSSTFDRKKSRSIKRELTPSQTRVHKSLEKESKRKAKPIDYTVKNSIETTPIMNKSNYSRRNGNESFDKSRSPSISWVSPAKVGCSPDTPDYCPIINAQYRKDWIGRLKPYDEITEFPLRFEEESESKLEFEISDAPRTSQTSTINSPVMNRSKSRDRNNGMIKCSSKDSLYKHNLNITSASILKAFKNSPCNQLLIEYFKNKSLLEKRYDPSHSNNSRGKY